MCRNPSIPEAVSRRTFLGGAAAWLSANHIPGSLHASTGKQRFHSDTVSFFVISDTHYLADKENPTQIDAGSAECTGRLIEQLNRLPGTEIPERAGGGVVQQPACVIHAGDVIDTGDKNGPDPSVMQRTEMQAFERSMGLTGRDAALDFPICEVHGNHDGPSGQGYAIERIIARNRSRPGLKKISPEGLHYSWDVGNVHFVNVGIVVGSVSGGSRRRRYAPLNSLDFLVADLREHVGTSGRPVVITHHIDLARYTVPVAADAPFANQEWDPADVGGFHASLAGYNIAAIFHGHTHGRSVWRWNGQSTIAAREPLADTGHETDPRRVYDVFNCDNSGTPQGGQQAFFYVAITPDQLTVREFATRDGWKTGSWNPVAWQRAVTMGSAS